MGLGAGHILDMINRSKQNRAQRPSQRRKFKDNPNPKHFSSASKLKPQFKTVPTEELNEIKQQIRDKAKSEQTVRLIKQLIVFLILITAIMIFFL